MLLDDILKRDFTPEIEKAFVDLIVDGAQRAYAATRFLEKPEREYLEPHLRRTNIESGLVPMGSRFGNKLEVMSGVTDRRHGYRVVAIGKTLLMVGYVEDDRRVPRHADFRNQLAGNPGQFLLFPEDEANRQKKLEATKASTCLFVTYRTAGKGEIAAINIVLVDASCSPVDSRDLLSRVAHNAKKKAETEIIPDTLTEIKRKVAPKRKGGTGA